MQRIPILALMACLVWPAALPAADRVDPGLVELVRDNLRATHASAHVRITGHAVVTRIGGYVEYAFTTERITPLAGELPKSFVFYEIWEKGFDPNRAIGEAIVSLCRLDKPEGPIWVAPDTGYRVSATPALLAAIEPARGVMPSGEVCK